METEFDYTATLDKLHRVANNMGVSLSSAVDSIRDLALMAKENTIMPGDYDARKGEYKTLQYTHEVMKN